MTSMESKTMNKNAVTGPLKIKIRFAGTEIRKSSKRGKGAESHIIKTFVKGAKEHRYHATKGWRSRRA